MPNIQKRPKFQSTEVQKPQQMTKTVKRTHSANYTMTYILCVFIL